MANSKFELHSLSNEQLNTILTMRPENLEIYIHILIENHYPPIDLGSEPYKDLQTAYKSSFTLEKMYRSNLDFQEGFTAVYTKTGLIRNIVNDIYYTEDDLITH